MGWVMRVSRDGVYMLCWQSSAVTDTASHGAVLWLTCGLDIVVHARIGCVAQRMCTCAINIAFIQAVTDRTPGKSHRHHIT